jgi:hypothetical protein
MSVGPELSRMAAWSGHSRGCIAPGSGGWSEAPNPSLDIKGIDPPGPPLAGPAEPSCTWHVRAFGSA